MNTCASCGPTCMPLIKDLCAMCFAKANKAAMTKKEKNSEIRRTLIDVKYSRTGSVALMNNNNRLPGRGMKWHAKQRYG